MNVIFKPHKKSLPTKSLKILLTAFVLLLVIFPLTACKKKINYHDYVSELRSNIFLAETDEFSLRIYSVEKESPYATDGVPQEIFSRTEVYLVAPSGDKSCNLLFNVQGKEYGGEMSFDNVKGEYYFYCTLDTSALSQLVCSISYGETAMELTALSVRTEKTLSPAVVLNNLFEQETELFTAMTDKYGFAGEIYVRLLYESSTYYYVGVIDRKGNVTAFLINAETGIILAKREK